MKEQNIKEKIVENLTFEKELRRDSFGEILLAALLILLIIILAIIATCFGLNVKMVLFTYQELFRFIIVTLVLDIALLIHIARRKPSVSQKAIKKHVNHLLERVLFFKNQGNLETCYVILNHDAYVRTPEELELVIADLKEMVQSGIV